MGIFSKNRNKYKNLRKAGYIIGEHTYVGKHTGLCAPDKIKIGDYCCIANNVFFNPSELFSGAAACSVCPVTASA